MATGASRVPSAANTAADALRVWSVLRAERLQAVNGVGILPHEQQKRRRLPVRFRSPMLPLLERAFVDLEMQCKLM